MVDRINSGYDVQRALHLHEQLLEAFERKAQGNEILLHRVHRDGGEKLLVGPQFGRYITDAVEFATFKTDLSFRIEPDFSMDSVSVFDNVPGFVIRQRKVVQDPRIGARQGDFAELDKLVRLTKRRAIELVHRTEVFVYPDIDNLRRAVWDIRGKRNPTPYDFSGSVSRNPL